MRWTAILLLLASGCVATKPGNEPPPNSVVQAAPVGQYGHLSPIQLPHGEYFDGWIVTAESNPGGNGSRAVPERRYFSTSTLAPAQSGAGGVHALRDASGVPVLIVKDPPQ